MIPLHPWVRGLVVVACVLFLNGCITMRNASVPPPPTPPQNYFSDVDRGAPMRRVAVLPIFSTACPETYVRELESAFQSELNKKAFFEVVMVGRGALESIFGERQYSSVTMLPADLGPRLRERYGVDGVIFTDLTHFSPYRPLSMGIRVKLVDVSTSQIRWAFDYVFDSGHASVAEAAKRYQRTYSDEHRPLSNDGGSILLSPARFAKYVASETFGSLKAEEEIPKTFSKVP